jgi:hypothetical protein
MMDGNLFNFHESNQLQAETKPGPYSVAPSVSILALNVRFDVPKEAQMVPSFLGCFPFIHTLHVQVAFYFLIDYLLHLYHMNASHRFWSMGN